MSAHPKAVPGRPQVSQAGPCHARPPNLAEGPGQLQTDEMLEAVVSRSELSVLDITHKVLREDRVASPEAIREVDAPTEAFLLRTGEVLHRAPDHGPIEVESQH